jgi:hypothetical protein
MRGMTVSLPWRSARSIAVPAHCDAALTSPELQASFRRGGLLSIGREDGFRIHAVDPLCRAAECALWSARHASAVEALPTGRRKEPGEWAANVASKTLTGLALIGGYTLAALTIFRPGEPCLTLDDLGYCLDSAA